ncbi:MAG: Uma2 family endonuclease [Acidobacteriaceae bacterium]|nr:Uma2 family endonuclease [Acidobacteriaceae bacterium]
MAVIVEATPKLVFTEYGHKLIIQPGEDEDPQALFERICADFDKQQKLELDSDGNIIITAPAGNESSYRNNQISKQLSIWADQDGRGKVFDSSTGFKLPDGSCLGSDAAWISNERIAAVPRKELRGFARLVPEFIVELKSQTDRFSELRKKMHAWRRNGVELGWLIHPEKQFVLIYRLNSEEPEEYRGESIRGEGPLSGFTLDLRPVWTGLDI